MDKSRSKVEETILETRVLLNEGSKGIRGKMRNEWVACIFLVPSVEFLCHLVICYYVSF